ncbi:MAG: prophage antirepressor [Parcubacteria group bacterium Licking1014_17]|nr:MAG: prophage antirepressor [Parcubacteria group bacterium Licking1014_17]
MEKKHIMQSEKLIVNFENVPVRRAWDEEKEQWYFAIVDVVEVLSGSPRPRKYWNALKTKLKQEGSELSQSLGQLKMRAKDGKNYKTDVADTETVLRVIQSIPSPKAEPFKQWLARVGYERLQETINPELAVDRARSHWKQVGMSEKWIEQRMRGQETRNKLTDYWQESGVQKGIEYAKLTDIIHYEWSGLTTKTHKRIKELKGQNLRDNMTEAELIFTALAELSTTQIAKTEQARGYNENAKAGQKGGRISGDARRALEQQTGKKVVSTQNFLPPKNDTKKLN